MDNSEILAKLDTSMLWFQDAYQNGFNRSANIILGLMKEPLIGRKSNLSSKMSKFFKFENCQRLNLKQNYKKI
jgi:hypothetical protein